MKTSLGVEVDLDPDHIVLDENPAPAKGAQQPILFSAHVYCGHGRPSLLLLNSCYFLLIRCNERVMLCCIVKSNYVYVREGIKVPSFSTIVQ